MGMPKGFKKLTVTGVFFITALAGCAVDQNEAGGGSTTSAIDASYANYASASKILLEEASVEDLIPHKAACPASKNGKHLEKICIQICHVPPGNPENSHDKILPLAAIKAHLGHGDYLGRCGASNGDDTSSGGAVDDTSSGGAVDDTSSGGAVDDTSSGGAVDDTSSGGAVDDTSSGGAVDDTSSGGTGETTPQEYPVVPQFCEPYYEVDKDCDGFNDSTGMPYL